ncbi:MAG TPA: Ig-like domain-containing protein, partial [Vicinamibacterales bacterium]|nr:Ig-like domain-containing protein [Vicinamibacterales bacterium]
MAVFLYAFGVATLVAAVFPTNPVWTSPGEPVGLPSVRTWSRSAAPAASSGTGTLRLSPQDTYLNVDSTNYSSATTIRTRTFPDYMPASAALMKFDLSALPPGALVQSATLHAALVEADPRSGTTYNVSAQKVLGRNPVVARATGYTSDGVTAWSPSTCCAEGAPLAQADLSPPYDTRAVNKTPGLKSWTMTAMVQEWRANPATNFGVVLNADATKPKNRYRYFASMEHPDPNLRPYLEVTFQAGDATPPTVAITAPGPGAILSNTVTLFATAQDNVGVAGVQFQLDGVPLGAERTAAPYNLTLDTTTLSDGNYVLTAVARDAAGNAASSPGVSVTVSNGTLLLEPEDTYLNLDTTNYSDAPLLSTYTWPAYSVGNAILMKFNLSALPSGAQVDEATLYLSLVDRDAAPETSYTVSAHKVLNRNPLLSGATGSTFDGATSWTPSSCCYNGVPMAQSDISNAYDQRAIDKTLGFKTWTLTTMVEEWLANPGSNFGLLLNSDPTKPADRYRFFASMEHSDASLRPYLRVKFRTGGPPADTTPPTVSMTAPASGASVAGSVNVSAAATDNVGVTSVQFQLDGANVGAADTTAPYSTSWNTTTTTNGSHTLTAVARDAAGNSTTSVPVTVTVSNPVSDTTPPTVSMTAPAGGSTVSGSVNVTATASDNVGVSSVQFQLDGANLGAADTTAPYATSWNTTAASNGSHTLRAVARDAAGNSTTSASVTVTVSNDTTPPTVSMTAPAAGATVSGTVNVSANASDNIGVTSVQFQLDGANLGAADTTSPYAISWNTTSVSDGSHTLRAVARDAAGNSTTSAAVSVTVSNAAPPPPPPPSGGIASRFPGDVGIETDSNVVFVERFDQSVLSTLFSRWTDILNGSAMSFSTDAPAGSPVAKSLNVPWSAASTGGHLYKQIAGVNDTLYVRYYVKYPTSGSYQHEGVWMGGYNPPLAWPNPQAGVKPTGNDRFSAGAEQSDNLTRFDHYNYWANMRADGGGTYWGNTLLNNASVRATPGQWMCV